MMRWCSCPGADEHAQLYAWPQRKSLTKRKNKT